MVTRGSRPWAARSLLAFRPRALSTKPALALAAQTAAWGLRLSHENTFLSWGRNAIISTVAGVALVQYRKNEGRPPLAAFGLLCMGGGYMITGSIAYVLTAVLLRHSMQLNVRDLIWISLQATWPVLVWGLSFLCMLDEEPEWLMDVLQLARLFLPSVLHDNLFLTDAEAVLEPIVRLTVVIARHEQARLRALEYQRWWHLLGARFLLTNDDPPSLEEADAVKLHLLELDESCAAMSELVLKARDSQDLSVSASEAVGVLSRLNELLNVIEVMIESDIARLYNVPLWGRIAVVSSRMEKGLSDELDTLRYLRRRISGIPVMPKMNITHRESH
jgi:hypothetical protein